jgi:hypothetical protein
LRRGLRPIRLHKAFVQTVFDRALTLLSEAAG